MTESRGHKQELAIRVVAAALGGSAAVAGPEAAIAAAAITPVLETGLGRIFDVVTSRRYKQAAETLTDGADDFGAQTDEEFLEFVEAAIWDSDRQELLARALTIAQDMAMRDKRRALGRVVAQAARDTGTTVDNELIHVRVIADLDEPHIRLLRLMATKPPHQDAVNRQMEAVGRDPIRQWHPSDLGQADPGLADVVWSLLPVLDRHGLISGGYDVITWAGHEPEYTITPYGEWFLTMLAEPE